jgi:hypothetical protein
MEEFGRDFVDGAAHHRHEAFLRCPSGKERFAENKKHDRKPKKHLTGFTQQVFSRQRSF